MKKIFISTSSFGSVDLKPIDLLKAHEIYFELNPLKRTLTEDEVIEFLKEKEGLIAGTEPLTERVFGECKNLEVISRVGVGLDNVDVEAAKRRNIKVFNTPDSPTNAVAELTIGLILSLLRAIGSSDIKVKKGIWKKEMGNLLQEKKVGIVGFGRIGRRLAQLLETFHCRISVYDPFVSHSQDSKVEYVNSLDVLLKTADIVSLHLPYSRENHHLINKERLEIMNPNAILINTSRGGLVDEKALYDCLKNGQIRGTALDTFEKEPYSGELRQLENVVLTPHIGSYTRESRVEMEIAAVINIFKGFGVHVEY